MRPIRGRAPSRRVRHRSGLAWACLLSLALLDCGPNHARTGAKSSTLTVLYPTDELWHVPAEFLLFLPLAAQSPQCKLEGRLARSWEHSRDYRTWTVHLRSGVRWHDGAPVTALDVKFTFDLASQPAIGDFAPDAQQVTVLDDSTVTIRFHRPPVEWWLDYLPVYPRHILVGLDPGRFYEWDFWSHPVGDGPYRYVRHLPHTMLELAANPDFYRGKPRIDRVILKFGEQSLTELLSGNVDAIAWVREMDLLKIREDPRFRVYYTVAPEHIRTILWNERNPLFRDPRVRRALTLAIDRRELLQVLNLPAKTPVFDVLFSRDQFHRDEVPQSLPYDPEAAKRLLAEAGWRDSDGDGVLDQGGRPFRFRAFVRAEEDQDKAAVFVQSQLQRVGIRMAIEILEPAAAWERIRAGDFQAAFGIVNEDLDGPLGHLDVFGAGSIIGYRNARVSATLRDAAERFDPVEIDRRYREVWPIFQADLPATFLYPLVQTTVAHRRVRGLSSPYREDPVWYMDELRLEDSLP